MRPIILVLSLVLGVMTLILLTLSACFLLNAYWEMRDQRMTDKKTAPAKTPAAKAS